MHGLALFLFIFLFWNVPEVQSAWAPDFIIIGAQKSGTTSLIHYISQHPQVAKTETEIHFFDAHYKYGLEWYKKQFPERKGPDGILGEKSPYYLCHPLVPQRVFENYPEIKIILILRNPVDRAYSQFWMNKRNKSEQLSFEEALAAETGRLEGEYEKIIQDPNYDSYNYRKYSYCTRGIYIDQIRRWFDYFPSEQFLILTLNDLKNDPQGTMAQVFQFLEVPNYALSHYTEENAGKNYPPMDPSTRIQLAKFFEPYNEELEEFLGRKLNWR